MEFGDFDDDLFAEERQEKVLTEVQYKPKVLTCQWFSREETLPEDAADQMQLCVYQGDHHYYRGEWSSAAEAYTGALEHVAPSNPTMRRLLLESLARCRLRCGDVAGALHMGEKLLEESTSEDQLFGAHSLLVILQDAAGNIPGQIKSLKFCLDVRPASAQQWIQLGKTYMKLVPNLDQTGALNISDFESSAEMNRGQCNHKETKNLHDHDYHYEEGTSCSGQTGELRPSRTDASSANSRDVEKQTKNDHQSACLNKKCVRCVRPPHQPRCSAMSHHGLHEVKHLPRGKSENIMCNHSQAQPTVKEDIHQQCSGQTNNVGAYTNGTMEDDCNLDTHIQEDGGRVINTNEKTKKGVSVHRSSSIQEPDGGLTDDLEDLSLSDKRQTIPQLSGVQNGYRTKGSHSEGPLIDAAQCLIRAQLLLKSVHGTAVSFAKRRNTELLIEVECLLTSLALDPATLHDVYDQTSRSSSIKEDKRGTHR